MRSRLSNPPAANAWPRASSSSGWLGGLFSPGSSTGSTSPTPKKCAHVRLARFLAKYGLPFAVSHAAMAGQYQLEQTFLVPVSAMLDERRAPLRVLERIKGRRLA